MKFPQPRNVVFAECFLVPEITGKALTTVFYRYRHICRQKFPENEPQPPRHERNWFIVGSRIGIRTRLQTQSLPLHNYVPIKQWHVQFVFLKEMTVELLLGFTIKESLITFQSLEQSQAFYKLTHDDVNMSKAVSIVVPIH